MQQPRKMCSPRRNKPQRLFLDARMWPFLLQQAFQFCALLSCLWVILRAWPWRLKHLWLTCMSMVYMLHWRRKTHLLAFGYKERSIWVPIVPKITVRWRLYSLIIAKIGILKFWNFPWKKSRQNERSSVLCSLNVNKVSRVFSCFFFYVKFQFVFFLVIFKTPSSVQNCHEVN